MKDSMIFYKSFAKAIKRRPESEQLKALWAIIDYGLEGIEPVDDGSDAAYMSIFEMAQPQIDANVKRQENGCKGGRPPKDSPKKAKKEAEEEDLEPVAEKPSGPVAGSFLLNDGSLYEIAEADLEEMQKLYPGIDCTQELRKITGWCLANPKYRKTRRGAPRFLNSWLSRAQDQASRNQQGSAKKAPTNRFLNFEQRDTSYDTLMLQSVKADLEKMG